MINPFPPAPANPWTFPRGPLADLRIAPGLCKLVRVMCDFLIDAYGIMNLWRIQRWGMGICMLLAAGTAGWSQTPPSTETSPESAYTVGIGDRLGVALTLRPLGPDEDQPVGPGDVLTLAYHFGIAGPEKPYRLQPGDQLKLYFRYSPEIKVEPGEKIETLSQGYTIQTDGTLPLVGLDTPLKVLDKNTSEVTTLLQTAYKNLLTSPVVVVNIAPQYKKQLTLKQLFQNQWPVPFPEVVVPPDGKLSVPLIPEVQVAGLTVRNIGEELTNLYRQMGYTWTTVSVWFKSIAGGRHAQLKGLMAEEHGPLSCEVLPGGEITLPFIVSLPAKGKTPGQIADELSNRYAQRGFDRVSAAVWVEQTGRR